MSLGYWQRLLLSLHPACDTTGLHLTNSGVGVRCFLVDEAGYLVLHPAILHPSPSAPYTNNTMHITVQEPLLSMTLLDAGGGEQLLQKEVCGEWWRGRIQRRYRLNLTPGRLVTSQHAPGKWCVSYSLAAVPGTNLVFGVINQTCATATAFCPCNMMARVCLYCQFVDKKACECPCECILDSATPCSVNASVSFNPTSYSSDAMSSKSRGGSRKPVSLPLCYPEPPQPSTSHHHQIALLNELGSCRPLSCEDFERRLDCLGIPGCEWCQLTVTDEAEDDLVIDIVKRSSVDDLVNSTLSGHSDRVWTQLANPKCVPHHQCPGGVMGGVSPYPRGLAPQPHHKESHRITPQRNMPLAPGN